MLNALVKCNKVITYKLVNLMNVIQTILRAYHFLCLGSGLENGGQDCWGGCNKKQGKCAWCGTNGWCCRESWIGNGCDGTLGGPNQHLCVLKPSGIFFKTSK